MRKLYTTLGKFGAGQSDWSGTARPRQVPRPRKSGGIWWPLPTPLRSFIVEYVDA